MIKTLAFCVGTVLVSCIVHAQTGGTEVSSDNTGAFHATGTPQTLTLAKFDDQDGERVLTSVTINLTLKTWGTTVDAANFGTASATSTFSADLGFWVSRSEVDIPGMEVFVLGAGEGYVIGDALGTVQEVKRTVTLAPSTEWTSYSGRPESDPAVGAFTVTVTDGQYLAGFIGDGTFEIDLGAMQFISYSQAGRFVALLESGMSSIDMDVIYEWETVPEPSSAMLLALGCSALALCRRRTKSGKSVQLPG